MRAFMVSFVRKSILTVAPVGLLLSPVGVLGPPQIVQASSGQQLFIRSAVENPDTTVTLRLRVGTSHGQTVYYIVTDSDDGATAQGLGINRSQRFAHRGGEPMCS